MRCSPLRSWQTESQLHHQLQLADRARSGCTAAAVLRSMLCHLSRFPECFVASSSVAMFSCRTNLSFAAVQLNADLGFDSQTYGLGAGAQYIDLCLLPGLSAARLSHANSH